jgi:hypothetical protein
MPKSSSSVKTNHQEVYFFIVFVATVITFIKKFTEASLAQVCLQTNQMKEEIFNLFHTTSAGEKLITIMTRHVQNSIMVANKT